MLDEPGRSGRALFETYDYPVIQARLLDPLGPGGDRRYRPKVFDNPTQRPVEVPDLVAPPDAVLVADGGFLLRDELRHLWELRIFVTIGFDLVLERGAQRDQVFMASIEAARARYLKRYIPGEQLYLRTVRPLARADVIIDNSDPASPRRVRPPSA
jgi:uridine kinase